MTTPYIWPNVKGRHPLSSCVNDRCQQGDQGCPTPRACLYSLGLNSKQPAEAATEVGVEDDEDRREPMTPLEAIGLVIILALSGLVISGALGILYQTIFGK